VQCLLSPPIISFMEPVSFTIEVQEHLPPEKREYCLDQLSNTGASVERHTDHVFRVVCSKPSELARVGWLLFHTHLSSLCRVTSTSGGAEARASAYQKPLKR